MSTVINGKVKPQNVTRKFTTFNTTDGKQWPDVKIANKWQQKLNKSAQAVLDGKTSLNGTKKVRKVAHKRSPKVVFSATKRAVIKSFVDQTGSEIGKGIVSINRLIHSLQSNPKLVTQLNKILVVK